MSENTEARIVAADAKLTDALYNLSVARRQAQIAYAMIVGGLKQSEDEQLDSFLHMVTRAFNLLDTHMKNRTWNAGGDAFRHSYASQTIGVAGIDTATDAGNLVTQVRHE